MAKDPPLEIGVAASLLPEYWQPVSLRSAECWLLDIEPSPDKGTFSDGVELTQAKGWGGLLQAYYATPEPQHSPPQQWSARAYSSQGRPPHPERP